MYPYPGPGLASSQVGLVAPRLSFLHASAGPGRGGGSLHLTAPSGGPLGWKRGPRAWLYARRVQVACTRTYTRMRRNARVAHCMSLHAYMPPIVPPNGTQRYQRKRRSTEVALGPPGHLKFHSLPMPYSCHPLAADATHRAAFYVLSSSFGQGQIAEGTRTGGAGAGKANRRLRSDGEGVTARRRT